MSLAEDMLEVARYLLRQNSKQPTDAAIRRSISTAYYALFHHLTEVATLHLVKDSEQRVTLARTFDHGKMRHVCKSVADERISFLGSTIS